MGFFMRHFERQADLYSAAVMGSPRPTVSSLEKIALLSGRIRDLPSWHHFSIRQRVDTLWRTLKDPGLAGRHTRFIAACFGIYLTCMTGLAYLVHFGPVKEGFTVQMAEKRFQRQLEEDPENMLVHQALAEIYQRKGEYAKAMDAYEKLLRLDSENALALNNLAWFLVTSPKEALRDERRGLALARKAVALERSPMFLDTLAEALFANGQIPEAIDAVKEAIATATENKSYYEKQLKRFAGEVDDEGPPGPQ